MSTRIYLFSLSLMLSIATTSFAQTVNVQIGTNNVPITEVQFEYNGSTVTQTSGVTATNTATTLPVSLNYVEVNDSTFLYANSLGNVVRNNNFAANVGGVGVYEEGSFIPANNASTFDPALEKVVNSNNLMQFLYYDGVSNIPSGDDFDIYFAKGIRSTDYVIVGERDGNTYFTVTPLDAFGNQIAGSNPVRFGFTTSAGSGNGTNRYDWDIGYAPTNYTAQSMVYTVIEASLFNLSGATIFGFRIDNNGEADVKFMGLSETGFENNPTNPQIGGITGSIFNDADGLSDATVNGSTIATPDGTTLYANLYDSNTGLVIATQAIKPNGTYEFLDLDPSSDYAVSISTNQGTVGNAVPPQNLPAAWVYTGDHSNTTPGNDGTPDGIQSSLSVAQTLVVTINYGIEKQPTADAYSFGISNPQADSSMVIGMQSTSDLSGDDDEDGALGTGNDFGITSLPTNNNDLKYNGMVITLGQDGINPPSPSNPFVINNYNPSLLEIQFTGDAAQTSTSFDYVSFDEAGIASTPVSYELNFGALPVEWLYFEVQKIDKKAHLNFATATETNSEVFHIEKSVDGVNFTVIGSIEAARYSTEVNKYAFVDNNLDVGHNYYRIKQVDFDGTYDLTKIRVVYFEQDNDPISTVYPNPIGIKNTIATLEFESEKEEQLTISVYNLLGTEVQRFNVQTFIGLNTQPIDLNNLDWGTYFVRIGDRRQTVMFKILE